MTSNHLTIGLLWHSVNSGNLGVGGLSVAHLAVLDEVARREGVTVDFRSIGWADRGEPYVTATNLTTVDVRLKDFLPVTGEIWKVVRRCDVVFDIGLGDSFTDIYGAKRFVTQALSKLLVIGTRTPLVLSPQTIGPFSHRVTEWIARRILRSASTVCTRDELSSEYVHDLDPDIDVVEATDLAMALPYDQAGQSDGPSSEGRTWKVGFNVSGLLMAAGGSDRFGLSLDYPQFVRRSIASMLRRPETDVHLVAHVLADENSTDDDSRWCRQLAEEFPGVVLAPRFSTPQEAKSYIARLDGFIGARMHACIAAFSSGVPVLPVAYSRKFSGMFGALGYRTLIDARADDGEAADVTRNRFLDELAQHRADTTASLAEAARRLELYERTVATTLNRLLVTGAG